MQTKQLKYLTVAAASVLIVSVAYAADKPEDSTKEPSGATFAHTCAACHGTYGYSNDSAFPGLAGMDHQVFVREMKRLIPLQRPSELHHESHCRRLQRCRTRAHGRVLCRFTKET